MRSKILRDLFIETAITCWMWRLDGLGTNVRRGDGHIPLGCILNDVTNKEERVLHCGMEVLGKLIFLLVLSFTWCLVYLQDAGSNARWRG